VYAAGYDRFLEVVKPATALSLRESRDEKPSPDSFGPARRRVECRCNRSPHLMKTQLGDWRRPTFSDGQAFELIPHDGTLGYSTDGCSALFGTEERTPCIPAVVEACDRFVYIELALVGFLVGCHGCRGTAAGHPVGGVEASNGDFQFMGFRNNDLE